MRTSDGLAGWYAVGVDGRCGGGGCVMEGLDLWPRVLGQRRGKGEGESEGEYVLVFRGGVEDDGDEGGLKDLEDEDGCFVCLDDDFGEAAFPPPKYSFNLEALLPISCLFLFLV